MLITIFLTLILIFITNFNVLDKNPLTQFYSLSSERTSAFIPVYIKVAPGQGTHGFDEKKGVYIEGLPPKNYILSEQIEISDLDLVWEETIQIKKSVTPFGEVLKLNEIYPNYNKLKYIYTFQAAYKIEFSKNFYSIVVHVLKGDHELETILINYNDFEDIIDYKTIAYDEIAESISQTTATIEKNKKSNELSYPPLDPKVFKTYARYPAGKPDNIDLTQLTLKKD